MTSSIHGHHQGFTIFYEPEEGGYRWEHGGYFETVGECKQDIADWNCEEMRIDPAYQRDDSPSLPNPWWLQR